MQKRLHQIIDESGLTLTQISRETGIPQPYLSMMLSGKRPVSAANWLKILTKLEGLTRAEAQVQLAKWQIEDARKLITQTRIVVKGNHNEINLGAPEKNDNLQKEINAMSPEERIIIKKFIKSLHH